MRIPFLHAGLGALAVLAVACGSGGDGPKPSQVPAEGDAVVFQKILNGELTAADGLARIGQSDGMPIQTSQGFIFAFLLPDPDPSAGKPWKLYSPNDRFAQVEAKTEAGMAWGLVPVAEPDGAQYQFETNDGFRWWEMLGRHVAYDGSWQVSLVRSSAPHLERWPGVGDAKIPGRTVRVWVHPGVAPTHFAYVHDGQNLFWPGANYGGWRLQDAAAPTTLVVGIDNSADRFAEYTDVTDLGGQGGKGVDYAGYVADTVLPFVEARYGTPARRLIMGSSLGGVISYVQELRRPGDFDMVASLSGTMGWGSISEHNPTMIEQYSALSTCPAVAFYLDSGGGPGSGCVDSDGDGILDDAPDAGDNYCENVQLKGVLEALGCDVTYVWAPNRDHSEASWRDRAPAIFDQFEAL